MELQEMLFVFNSFGIFVLIQNVDDNMLICIENRKCIMQYFIVWKVFIIFKI